MLKALFYPDVPFDSLYIPYIYKEIYLENVYGDIVRAKNDLTILDVGANIGCTVQFFRDFAKKVYAFEPASEHFEALKKNKEFNKWDNVELFNAAIADKDGKMFLNTNSNNRTCNSLTLDYKQGGETVKTMTFNTFFKENKIDQIDFCKFDVEGAEESILCAPGFADVAPMIKSMMVEFHFPNFPTIVDHMISLGYTAKRCQSSAIIVLFER